MASLTNTYHESRKFYKELFTQNSYWSTQYPNPDEAERWLKVEKYLCTVLSDRSKDSKDKLRILDIGCGRGWLTNLCSIYGDAEGVDPIAESIQAARRMYPHLKFFTGTAKEVCKEQNRAVYDVIITSEVLEHVSDKESFIKDMAKCLRPEGYVILTTPRGKLFKKWERLGYKKQPIEQWVTEAEVRRLFGLFNFTPICHDRVYIDLAAMSFLNRVCASRKLIHLLDRLGMTWFLKGSQYIAALYQVWCFHFKKE